MQLAAAYGLLIPIAENLVSFIFKAIAAYGLLSLRTWGRKFVMAASVLLLILIGINQLSLWFVLQRGGHHFHVYTPMAIAAILLPTVIYIITLVMLAPAKAKTAYEALTKRV